jgi:hypothetical protein
LFDAHRQRVKGSVVVQAQIPTEPMQAATHALPAGVADDAVTQLRDLLSAEQSAEMANENQNDRAIPPVVPQSACVPGRVAGSNSASLSDNLTIDFSLVTTLLPSPWLIGAPITR